MSGLTLLPSLLAGESRAQTVGDAEEEDALYYTSMTFIPHRRTNHQIESLVFDLLHDRIFADAVTVKVAEPGVCVKTPGSTKIKKKKIFLGSDLKVGF